MCGSASFPASIVASVPVCSVAGSACQPADRAGLYAGLCTATLRNGIERSLADYVFTEDMFAGWMAVRNGVTHALVGMILAIIAAVYIIVSGVLFFLELSSCSRRVQCMQTCSLALRFSSLLVLARTFDIKRKRNLAVLYAILSLAALGGLGLYYYVVLLLTSRAPYYLGMGAALALWALIKTAILVFFYRAQGPAQMPSTGADLTEESSL
eukprot:m.134391 g.134391  ORF g.134391 m.134391 type:complete len:211 (-) comp9517_c0_seq3:935-1567(-)